MADHRDTTKEPPKQLEDVAVAVAVAVTANNETNLLASASSSSNKTATSTHPIHAYASRTLSSESAQQQSEQREQRELGMKRTLHPSGDEVASNKRVRSSFEQQQQLQQQQQIRPWPPALHAHMAQAIFLKGVKHATPSLLMEKMQLLSQHNSLTSEHVKSHLQKYRKNHKRSLTEFMKEYRSWMNQARAIGSSTLSSTSASHRGVAKLKQDEYTGDNDDDKEDVLDDPFSDSNLDSSTTDLLQFHLSSSTLLNIMGAECNGDNVNWSTLLGGDRAAYLSFEAMRNEMSLVRRQQGIPPATQKQPPPTSWSSSATTCSNPNLGSQHAAASQVGLEPPLPLVKSWNGVNLQCPKLTVNERQSPLGMSLLHTLALFKHMTRHIMRQRLEQGEQQTETSGLKHDGTGTQVQNHGPIQLPSNQQKTDSQTARHEATMLGDTLRASAKEESKMDPAGSLGEQQEMTVAQEQTRSFLHSVHYGRARPPSASGSLDLSKDLRAPFEPPLEPHGDRFMNDLLRRPRLDSLGSFGMLMSDDENLSDDTCEGKDSSFPSS